MYTVHNYKTKKALREDVAALLQCREEACPPDQLMRLEARLAVWQPNSDITGAPARVNGQVTLEGPHYPAPHRWYASATIADGVVVKVK